MSEKGELTRTAGILMPVFSLPGRGRIGCFSKEAEEFVDFLGQAGFGLWQVLPLGPTSYGDSPYQSFSTFAGNPYFIDLQEFVREGLLTEKKAEEDYAAEEGTDIDYGALYEIRFKTLKQAFLRADKFLLEDRQRFAEENKAWLPDYCLFMALKDAHGGAPFFSWEEELKLREKNALEQAREKLALDIAFHEFLQYMFYRQWFALKKRANDSGIRIIGDLPIYVAYDSADVWARPELFSLNEELEPLFVAGCPPDAFSEDGQLWGNPLYDWKKHKDEGYAWWIARIRHSLELFDLLRIDHFRGFAGYYAIPAGEETAKNGSWEKGPGRALFSAAEKELGSLPLIAEDLGHLTPDVIKLLNALGYPGMKVLQFAFSGPDNPYLPHNHIANSIVYTGTHDNPTTLSWAGTLPGKERKFLLSYLGMEKKTSPKKIVKRLIREVMASPAKYAVLPLQDCLLLGEQARINTPSTLGSNWMWRLKKGALSEKLVKKLRKQNRLYDRLNKNDR